MPVYIFLSVYNHCDWFSLFGLKSSSKRTQHFINVRPVFRTDLWLCAAIELFCSSQNDELSTTA